MTDLHAPCELHGSGAVGRGIPGPDVRDLDDPVGEEVPTGDDRMRMLLIDVRTGDPTGPLAHAGVDQVADPGRGLLSEHRAGR